MATHQSNIHHYLVAAQGALPVDAAGNPWSGSYVYNSGNLVLDLLYNLMLESTGRLQKCRIYEMTENKTARSTISYLIVRDQAHENAYAKALETLGVDWGKLLPIPKTNAEKFPEVKKLVDLGLQSKQYTFDLTNASEAGKIFQGMSPSKDGTELLADEQAPAGVPSTIADERFEEFSPGLDTDLLALIQATADLEMAEVPPVYAPVAPEPGS
jgi:Mn-containing catalase